MFETGCRISERSSESKTTRTIRGYAGRIGLTSRTTRSASEHLKRVDESLGSRTVIPRTVARRLRSCRTVHPDHCVKPSEVSSIETATVTPSASIVSASSSHLHRYLLDTDRVRFRV